MTAAYVDTNVFLYAIGTNKRYHDACRAIVEAIGAGRLRGEVATIVIQELATYLRRRSIPQAGARARDVARLAAAVHPVDRHDIDAALSLFDQHRSLSLPDALHAAVAQRRGIGVILSADTDFEAIPGLRRVDPLDKAAIASLMA